MSNGEIILYTTKDGTSSIKLQAKDGSVWLSQAEIAELFQTSPQNITLHIKAIYDENELNSQSTCKEHLQVRSEGSRNVQRQIKIYNLNCPTKN